MPPKIQPKNSSKPGQASKKNKEKKVAKTAEDKTFGLKNKSGAKQQKFCAKVEQQLANSKKDIRGGGAGKPAPLTKKEQKEAYLAQLDAMLVPVDGDRKVLLSKKQMEADKEKEVVYLTIEELVEVERLKLKNSGKELTKVTLESFLIWKTKKRAEKKLEAEKAVKQKEKYAKEGKIVSSTGKELFAYYKDQINFDDDEEAEELLDFASGLDFDKFIDDMEVRAMMEQVKGRVDDLESAIAEEEAADLLAEARATARENGGELDDDMLQSLGLTQEQLDKWNEDLGGVETARPEEDDIISIAETLLAEGKTGNVHSKASMQKKVASVRAQLDTARSEPEPTKFVAPKIVTHKEDLGARLKKKDDVSNLPYMHRNPAV